MPKQNSNQMFLDSYMNSEVKAISHDGNVAVGYCYNTSYGTAFILTEKIGMISLTDYLKEHIPQGYILTEATGISADGSIVIGISRRGSDFREYDAWMAFLPEFKTKNPIIVASQLAIDPLPGINCLSQTN